MPGSQGRAFGLDIDSALPLQGLLPVRGGGPRVRVCTAGRTPDADWAAEGAIVLAAPPPGATDGLAVEHHPNRGYRFSSRSLGAHLVSPDGLSITCLTGDDPDSELPAERMLASQLLPLAAVLQGLEVFHASAVELGGRVVALSGPQGAGKSTLALRLAARRATFFTDDALAVAPERPLLACHPGLAVANVHDPVLVDRALSGSAPFGAVLSREPSSVRATLAAGADQPCPLAALYLLDRRAGQRTVAFAPATNPFELIASTLNFAVRTPERLERQLDVCARIAAECAVVRVMAPGTMPAEELADRLALHARTL